MYNTGIANDTDLHETDFKKYSKSSHFWTDFYTTQDIIFRKLECWASIVV